MTNSHPPIQTPTAIAELDTVPLLSGVLAAAIGCAITVTQGVLAGWEGWRIGLYSGVALLFLLLVSLPGLSIPWVRRICEINWVFLGVGGLLGLLLQTLSGSAYAQPIAITVLFVHATLLLNGARGPTIAIGGLYLGLIALGQWLYGWRDPAMLLTPVLVYAAVLGFLFAFTALSIDQASARWRADQLAGELARERDYQARLVQINATVARELDLGAVLQQVAAAARSLAQADHARVWLREADNQLRLVALSPPLAGHEPTAEGSLFLVGQVYSADVLGNRGLLASGATTDAELLVLPLVFGDQHIGALELLGRTTQPFSVSDTTRLAPFAHAAAVAIRNAQLYSQTQLSATLAERNRLARELHDTIAQGLTAITMQLEAAQRSLDRDGERTRARLERATTLSRATLDDVRRSVWTLASPLIDSASLNTVLAEQCHQFQDRTGIAVQYHHHGPTPTLSSAAASQLLRIAQEALHNAEKHASAQHIRVSTQVEDGMLRLSVGDDGVGFEPTAVNGNGFGLSSLRERARLAGGELQIESAIGKGARITVELRT